MWTYTKSLASTFNGLLDASALHEEVLTNTSIVDINDIFMGIEQPTGSDDVNFYFQRTLTGGEQGEIDTVSAAHSFTIPKVQHYKVYPETRRVKGDIYRLCGTLHWPGSVEVGTIDYIDIVGAMDTVLTSYDVQVIDRSSNTTVASGSFSNTGLEAQSLTGISNVPTASTVLEILVRANGSKNNKVTVQEIQVYYGN